MNIIENAMSAAKISRYYTSSFASALDSDRLDGRLFADLAEQKKYFGGKLADAKRDLRSTLFGARGTLAAELRRATGDDRAAIESAIAGVDAELAE